MNMIGHHNKVIEVIELPVIMKERIANEGGSTWIAKETGAVALIEPSFEFTGKGLVEKFLGVFVPRLRVVAQPAVAAAFEADQEFLRDGIEKSPSDKNPGVALLPVGELNAVFLNFVPWIVEHGWSLLSGLI